MVDDLYDTLGHICSCYIPMSIRTLVVVLWNHKTDRQLNIYILITVLAFLRDIQTKYLPYMYNF